MAYDEAYFQEKKKKIALRNKLVMLFAGSAFIATGMFPFVVSIVDSLSSSNGSTNTVNQELDEENQRQQEETGYLSVLEREPDNITALAGLADIRLQQEDYAGSKELLERLKSLSPNDPNVEAKLAEVEINLASSNSDTIPVESVPSENTNDQPSATSEAPDSP